MTKTLAGIATVLLAVTASAAGAGTLSLGGRIYEGFHSTEGEGIARLASSACSGQEEFLNYARHGGAWYRIPTTIVPVSEEKGAGYEEMPDEGAMAPLYSLSGPVTFYHTHPDLTDNFGKVSELSIKNNLSIPDMRAQVRFSGPVPSPTDYRGALIIHREMADATGRVIHRAISCPGGEVRVTTFGYPPATLDQLSLPGDLDERKASALVQAYHLNRQTYEYNTPHQAKTADQFFTVIKTHMPQLILKRETALEKEVQGILSDNK